MQKGLIGVIVPVYNVEKYIAECIESILAQTYTNFRLILVNDGSPDNAGKICDEYAKMDSRITVIHQKNAGVTRARARGVKEAEDCEFITFVDSDDTINKDALDILYSFTSNNIDIIISAYDKDNTPIKSSVTNIEYRHWAVKNIYYIGAPWGKLIRKNLFNDFVFNIPSSIKIHEDTIMNIRIAFNVKNNIIFCKEKIYNYRQNENGAMRTIKKDIKYEELLHKYIKASIPNNDLSIYIKDTIPYRFSQWRQYYTYKYVVDDMVAAKFYIELKQDIGLNKFKMHFFDKVLFYCTNPLIRFLIINIKKSCNITERIFDKINHFCKK